MMQYRSLVSPVAVVEPEDMMVHNTIAASIDYMGKFEFFAGHLCRAL